MLQHRPFLRQGYRLSDRDLEEALADRWSLRRFCGLGLEDAGPDAGTSSRLRVELAQASLAEAIIAALNVQIEQRGLIIDAGTTIDATPTRILPIRATAWMEPAPADAS